MTEQTIAQSIALPLVVRYLKATGWKPGKRGDRYSLFLLPLEGDELELVVPNDSDGPRNLENVIRTLSQLEEKSEETIVFAIRSVGFDVVRSRLPDQLVRDDSIGLDVAAEYIKSTRRLFAASATVEMKPQQHFARLRKEAIAYANTCRFGHTFRGSFGFTIESPIVETNQKTIDGIQPSPPFERRVVQRLANGLAAVEEATREARPEIVADQYRSGLNANMCEELTYLFSIAKSTSVMFDFTWSPEWKPAIELREHSAFRLAPPGIAIIEEAARKLRVLEKQQQKVVYGLVTTLRSEDNPSDQSGLASDREIVVRWLSDDHGTLNVHIVLPAAEYLQAVKAHHDGKAISVSGTLEKVGRTWVLHDLINFHVPSF
jgi:hypothetical protein